MVKTIKASDKTETHDVNKCFELFLCTCVRKVTSHLMSLLLLFDIYFIQQLYRK